MIRQLLNALAFIVIALPAMADCEGQNLLDSMPDTDRAALQAKADAAPYAQGNFWRATRGNAAITIIGTYHLGDPRHAATLDVLTPLIETASAVLVEAGPEEEAMLLARMTKNPSLMLITEGPSLMEQLPADDWARLTKAMTERQIPAFMAAKFQPWYISMLLSVPPCAMDALAAKDGLDFGVMTVAEAASVPVRALEPYDTVLKLFGSISTAEQIEMVRTALVMETDAADTSITLADAYFAENSRVIWELLQDLALTTPGYTPERVSAEFAKMEELLMNARNRAWIPVIEGATTDGPVLVAFGALHLSGDEGVLNLLAQNGWTVERLPLQ